MVNVVLAGAKSISFLVLRRWRVRLPTLTSITPGTEENK